MVCGNLLTNTKSCCMYIYTAISTGCNLDPHYHSLFFNLKEKNIHCFGLPLTNEKCFLHIRQCHFNKGLPVHLSSSQLNRPFLKLEFNELGCAYSGIFSNICNLIYLSQL